MKETDLEPLSDDPAEVLRRDDEQVRWEEARKARATTGHRCFCNGAARCYKHENPAE